jgi:hypothetical protein
VSAKAIWPASNPRLPTLNKGSRGEVIGGDGRVRPTSPADTPFEHKVRRSLRYKRPYRFEKNTPLPGLRAPSRGWSLVPESRLELCVIGWA